MASFTLTYGTGILDNEILSGSIDWTRSGQYSLLHLYSDRKDIETTMSTFQDPVLPAPPIALTGSLPLEKNYDDTLEASWTTALANSDTAYNDVYVRYTVKSDAERFQVIDGESSKSPRGYREFRNNLVLFQDAVTPANSDKDQMSAYGFVKELAGWKRLKEAKFSKVGTANEQDAPSMYFLSSAAVINDNKANEKVFTATVKGLTRLQVTSVDTQPTLTDFIPFLVMQRPEYQYQTVESSYRKSPTGSTKTGDGFNDSTKMVFWTADTVSRLRQQNIHTTLVLDGDFEIDDGGTDRPIENGDFLSDILMYYSNIGGVDQLMPVNAPVLSVQYDPQSDNTTIVVGKV
jgi:hypothetical protein